MSRVIVTLSSYVSINFKFWLRLLLYIYIYVLIAAEDIEAGTRKMKIQAEPTLPIYLKVWT